MTPETANAIYDVLVETCGANNNPDSWMRDDFVFRQTNGPYPCVEYRFQGNLGFGGKFYCQGSRWWVSCYPEDETPARLGMIRAANLVLKTIKENL